MLEYKRGNKLRSFGTKVLSEVCMLKGCNFIAPQALIHQLYYWYLISFLNYRAFFDTSAKRSEAHVLKGCIKNGSIVKLYNIVQIINNVSIWVDARVDYSTSKSKINSFWSRKQCNFPKLHLIWISEHCVYFEEKLGLKFLSDASATAV